MAAARAQPSPPFASRELNGEVLLDELSDLRAAEVSTSQLAGLVSVLRDYRQLRAPDAVARLGQLARSRAGSQPAVAEFLSRWAARVKSDADPPLLVAHVERLALVAAMLGALRRASERLPRGGRR